MTRIFNQAYDSNASKCSFLSTILAVQITLGESNEGNVCVNRDEICIPFTDIFFMNY